MGFLNWLFSGSGRSIPDSPTKDDIKRERDRKKKNLKDNRNLKIIVPLTVENYRLEAENKLLKKAAEVGFKETDEYLRQGEELINKALSRNRSQSQRLQHIRGLLDGK